MSVFKIKLSRDEAITIKENQGFGAMFEGSCDCLDCSTIALIELHFFPAKHLTRSGPSLSLHPLRSFSVGVSQFSYILNTQWFISHVMDSLRFTLCGVSLLNLCIKVQKYVFVIVLHTQLRRMFELLNYCQNKSELQYTDRNKWKPWWCQIDGQISRR